MKDKRLNIKKVIIVVITITLIVTIALLLGKTNGRKKNNNEPDKIVATNLENTNNIIEEHNEPIKEYNNEIPIMCYHGVLDDAWGDKSIFVKVNEFENQMKYLNENGYTTLFISEIEEANKYEKPIIITFDDGYRDVYTNAFPILEKYNIKANLYIISGYLGGDKYLTTDMLKELAKSSLIEIGSHTISHSVLTKASEEELEKQLIESKEILEEITGKNVESLAYPTGAYNDRVMKATKKYYKYGISIVSGKEKVKELNTYELRRLYMERNFNLDKFKKMIEE